MKRILQIIVTLLIVSLFSIITVAEPVYINAPQSYRNWNDSKWIENSDLQIGTDNYPYRIAENAIGWRFTRGTDILELPKSIIDTVYLSPDKISFDIRTTKGQISSKSIQNGTGKRYIVIPKSLTNIRFVLDDIVPDVCITAWGNCSSDNIYYTKVSGETRLNFYTADYLSLNLTDEILFKFNSYEVNSSSTLSIDGGLYQVNTSFSCATTCLTIGANNITIDLMGYTLSYANTTTGIGISNTNYDNVTVINGTLIQLTSSAITTRGVYFSNANNGRISQLNISFNGTNNYGIFLSTSSNNTISSNYNYNYTTGYGIYLLTSSNNTISSNYNYNYTGGYGIFLSTSSNNTISSNYNYKYTTGYGIYLLTSSNNTISSNYNYNYTTGYGILLSTSSNNTISSNYNYKYTTGRGIYLYTSSNNNTISSNYNYNYTTGRGIYLLTSSNNTISSNYNYNYTTGYGIYLLTSSNNNTISSNYNYNYTTGRGIHLSTSSNSNYLFNNTVNSTSGTLISVNYSYLNIIQNNSFNDTDSTAMDVTIQLSQRNNTFIGNDFSKYMHINFTDVTAEFNQSQNNGSTFINTNTTALGVLNRTRTAWSVSNITFIDNWTTDVTVTYDIVGLTPNTKYSIYINGTIITYNVSSASGTIQPQSVVFPINIPKQITISTTLGNSLPNWAIGYYVAGGAALAGALYGAYRRRQRGSSMMIIYPELNIKFK